MVKWIFLGGALLGLADPYLLYVISEKWGFWPAVWTWLVPILVASPLTFRARRELATPPRNPAELPSRLAEIFLIPAANMALWYPGPITSVLGLLLLLGPARRAVARRLTGQLGRRLGGSMQFGRSNASVFSGGMPGEMRPSSGAAPGGLKRADGRVVEEPESPNELPENSSGDKSSDSNSRE